MGDQADPKFAGRGPKPILRTGVRVMLMTMVATIVMVVMMIVMMAMVVMTTPLR